MRAGTIVASNYVEMAKVLGTSFVEQHPDDRFVILVVDDDPIGDLPDGVDAWRLADLDLSAADIDMMRTIYDVMEFSTAVKPSFLRGLLRTASSPAEPAVYLDPDIYVYSPFDDVVAPAADRGIVLTPHCLHPIARDLADPTEFTIMSSGIFNLGFIAVGPPAHEFLDWWQERLRYDAIVDLAGNLFTDQRWVDWVPGLFDFHRCDEPGMNIAWWNIHERAVELAAGESVVPTIDGRPVRFIHFSGYDPLTPAVFSKHQTTPRTEHADGIPIRRLAEQYGERLMTTSHVDRRFDPYPWSTGANGLRLDRFVRRGVRRAVLAEHRVGVEPADMDTPFAFGPSSSRFLGWLEAIAGGTERWPVSRIERSVWTERHDLQAAFRDIDGDDAVHFRRWVRTMPDAREALGAFTPPVADDVALPGDMTVESLPRTPYRAARRLAGRSVRALASRLPE
ncbi:MAG: hypothetical protein AAF945_08210 [Actinomycetota bacterium]